MKLLIKMIEETSHIQRNHLLPYYQKEPIIFPFIQKYNPHSTDNNIDNIISSTNDSKNSFVSSSDEVQLVEDEITNSKKETETPSTIDFQLQSFS